jgi:hypothetical protein
MDTKELREKIRAANTDIEARVKSGDFRLQYDAAGDMFYFALTDYSPVNPVISLEDADAESTAYLRVEDGTWKVVGFDILSWKTVHLKSNRAWQKAFTALFKAVGTGDFKLEYDPEADDPLRVYVPAQVEELLDAA